MKIYSVRVDGERFQTAGVSDAILRSKQQFLLNGTSKQNEWKLPVANIFNPLLQRGSFIDFEGGAFIISDSVKEVIGDVLNISGELLPVRLEREKEQFYLYNVTFLPKTVLRRETKFEEDYYERNRMILEDFVETCRDENVGFPKTCFFKLPDDRVSIFVLEGMLEKEQELRYLIDKHKLTGLDFEELWSS